MFQTMMHGSRMASPYMRMGFYGGYSMMMGLAGLIAFIALVLSIIALVKVVRLAKRTPKLSDALNILDERYVKGEINKEEFDQMKKDLR